MRQKTAASALIIVDNSMLVSSKGLARRDLRDETGSTSVAQRELAQHEQAHLEHGWVRSLIPVRTRRKNHPALAGALLNST